MAKTNQLILNRIKCPDGTILTSRHVHDYRTHGNCMVDGGLFYIRRNITEYEELSQYYDDEDHEHNREYFEWGSRGKDGNEPLRRNKVKDLSTDHIQAILNTQNLPDFMEEIFVDELGYREVEYGET